MITEIMVAEAVAGAGLFVGAIGLFACWRQKIAARRDIAGVRQEIEQNNRGCLLQMESLGQDLEASKRDAQISLELLRDGRLGMPARARALGMLRAGLAAETAAAELGIPRNEVQLLAKVAALLAPRN